MGILIFTNMKVSDLQRPCCLDQVWQFVPLDDGLSQVEKLQYTLQILCLDVVQADGGGGDLLLGAPHQHVLEDLAACTEDQPVCSEGHLALSKEIYVRQAEVCQ